MAVIGECLVDERDLGRSEIVEGDVARCRGNCDPGEDVLCGRGVGSPGTELEFAL